VLAFSVAQRRYELGIRAALGATGSRIVALVARQAMGLVVVGVALGAGAAWVVAPKMQRLLYHVSPRDPLVYGGVAVVLLAVAGAAALVPAGRATRVDPSEALREE
ncbi:MAG TPA: FtsX-like permease family protein, partial [Longimicrobiales bacterium]|nr:FtsX-like permease family protein [Longimicrobiales bacterium]